jgi:hypothetical protein
MGAGEMSKSQPRTEVVRLIANAAAVFVDRDPLSATLMTGFTQAVPIF